MGQLDKLETSLNDVFTKKVPFKLPPEGRKWLATNLWWIALVFGLLQLWAAWSFWHIGHYADRLVDYANSLAAAYGVEGASTHLGMFYYITLIVLAVDAAILLLAAPGLKAMRKAGWNLFFYSLLINIAYGVVRIFSDYGSFGDLVWAVLGSAVGAFLLFQIRDMFVKSPHVAHKVEAKKA